MSAIRPAKRRRTARSISPLPPLSPEDSGGDASPSDDILERALNVLRVEADALRSVSVLYRESTTARKGLQDAVETVLRSQRAGGKLVVCGVGKSAYVGMKLVATSKSLGVAASFMHACEAVHGDLGDVRAGRDVVLFVSFSGKTPELLNLLPHLPPALPMIAVTAHARPSECPLLANRCPAGIVLTAPIPEKEEATFGVCAPTTSTTVALAVTDMLALTVADQLHQGKTKDVFKRNHPGGAIGMTHQEVEKLRKDEVDVAIVELPSPSISAESED